MFKDIFGRKQVKKMEVNISSTFINRSRCKFCLGGPKYYYYSRNPVNWVSPRKNNDHVFWFQKTHKRIVHDYYLSDEPSKFNSMRSFSHPVNYKGFRAKIHKNVGVNPYMDCVDFLSCGCGRSCWAFYQSSTAYRPEVSNRKGKYSIKY